MLKKLLTPILSEYSTSNSILLLLYERNFLLLRMIINVSHLCKERDRIKVFKNLKNSFLKNGILEFDLTMISQKIVITKYHEKCHLCSPARFR